MTDYKALYAQKLMTADAVAEQVQSNWLFGMDTGPSQTPAIMAAVANKIRNSDITGVNLINFLTSICMHLYDTSYTLFLILCSVEYI